MQKNFTRGESSKSTGLGTQKGLVCSKDRKEVSVAGTQQSDGQGEVKEKGTLNPIGPCNLEKFGL